MDFHAVYPINLAHESGYMILILQLRPHIGIKRHFFVKSVPYKVEDTAVEEHFWDCGRTVAFRIVTDRVTGAGRGLGYVLFENSDAIHFAVN